MDYEMQQEVWARLPLNEYQRNDMLQSLLTEVQTSQDEMDTVSDGPSQQPKKRKRQFNEQSESQAHMC
jgi:hypothetical protein